MCDRSAGATACCTSVVVRAEVLAGMRPHGIERTRELLDAFEWHPVDEAIAEEAGRLGRRWLPSHCGMDAADLLIAATANTLDLLLMTSNVRHFPSSIPAEPGRRSSRRCRAAAPTSSPSLRRLAPTFRVFVAFP
ncbi:MAG: PIN domain-containing protein [Pseudonocardiaceae bacterium]